MMHQAFSKTTPLLDTPLGSKGSTRWFPGPWGRDENMKPLQDFKRSKAFEPVERHWEKSAAEHFLGMYEQCILNWVVSRSKDQKSFAVEVTGERVGPSLFNLDPFGLLRGKGKELRNLITQASLDQRDQDMAGSRRFRENRQGARNGERPTSDTRDGDPSSADRGRRGGRSVVRNPLSPEDELQTQRSPLARPRGNESRGPPASEPRMRGRFGEQSSSSSPARRVTSADSSNVLREIQASRRQAQGEPPAYGSPRDGHATTETPLSRTRDPGGDQVRSPHFDDNLDELAELRSNRTAEIPANFFDDMDGE